MLFHFIIDICCDLGYRHLFSYSLSGLRRIMGPALSNAGLKLQVNTPTLCHFSRYVLKSFCSWTAGCWLDFNRYKAAAAGQNKQRQMSPFSLDHWQIWNISCVCKYNGTTAQNTASFSPTLRLPACHCIIQGTNSRFIRGKCQILAFGLRRSDGLAVPPHWWWGGVFLKSAAHAVS